MYQMRVDLKNRLYLWIKKLEGQLGVSLFERTNKKVMLTDAGKEILPYAHKAAMYFLNLFLKLKNNFPN